MSKRFIAIAAISLSAAAQAATLHVAVTGKDTNQGTRYAPFRTVQHAADVAQPGDVIAVHAGTYRERVSPPRGGTSEDTRIVFQAADGEKVVITGSEVVKNWVRVQADVWRTTLPNSYFGHFNPFSDLIHGDWFTPGNWQHHTGAVYLDGRWLREAATLDDVMKPAADDPLWYGEVDSQNTTIWAQFIGADPNRHRVEINVRQTVFYPEKTGINYITVRGFTLEDAATPWAPPTAEQIGVIGPHWSKGWIIENNVVRNSICSGISLGKYGDRFDNTSANSAEGYVQTIKRALADGWSKDNIGHHIVRHNEIYNCGQTGVVGSMGAAFSTITRNTIHDIHVRRDFSGAEIAAIKFHGAVDVQIVHNHIYRAPLGLWLDWMAQGTYVAQNLCHDNDSDAFVEVDHGPFLFANNLLLSPLSLRDNSQGGAYVHNLFAGAIARLPFDHRLTPILEPHSTAIADLHDNPPGDSRYLNNLFVNRVDLTIYENALLPMTMDGNAYLDEAKPSKFDTHAVVKPAFDPKLELISESAGTFLKIDFEKEWTATEPRRLVTSAWLGRTAISDLPFENPDGSPIRIDSDYLGKHRPESNPTPGPFEFPGFGVRILRIW